jgi:hypothetical protein
MTDATQSPAACSEPERRQFDFWLGEWEVRDAEGNLAGRNTISVLFDGCGLREEWRGASGHRGTSLNAWSPQRRVWHQTWVDASGLLLELEGGLRGGAMVLEGRAALPGEEVARQHRISWSVLADDRRMLRQHWEASTADGGWETIFDGRYRRVSD